MTNLFALLKTDTFKSIVLSEDLHPKEEFSPQDSLKKFRLNKRLARVNQSVKYFSDAGEHVVRILKLEGPRVFIGNPSLGSLMLDLADLNRNPKKDTVWVAKSKKLNPLKKVPSIEESSTMFDKNTVISAEHMKVLIDEAGQTVAKRLFKQFVSDADFTQFPSFVIGLDNLIAEFRGDKPITTEEVDEFAHKIDGDVDEMKDNNLIDKRLNEEDQPPSEDDDEFSEQTASVRMAHSGTAESMKYTLCAYLSALSTDDPAIRDLKDYAFKLGFRPDVAFQPNTASTNHLLSMSKNGPKYIAQFRINSTADAPYVLSVQHTRRGAKQKAEVIRPWRHVYSSPNKLITEGRKVLKRYEE